MVELYKATESSHCINFPDIESVFISLKPIQHLLFSEKLLNYYKMNPIIKNPFRKYLTPTYLFEDFDNER